MNFIPTFRYHETLAPEGRLITTEEELAELPAGWVDTPALFGKETSAAEVTAELPAGWVDTPALQLGRDERLGQMIDTRKKKGKK
jgi:hypothetical protein